MAASANHRKDIKLEAVRGIAACSVMVWHCLVAFFPYQTGIFPEFGNSDGVNGQIWFGLISGGGAVTLFFVLSAYVLTRSYLLNGDFSIILRGVVKRWPRLAGPVLLSALISWTLFRLNLMYFSQASAVSQSPWLKLYGYGLTSDKVLNFNPSLWYAVYEGSYETFFIGTDNSLNNNLWTMHYEFIGSFIAYGLAVCLIKLKDSNILISVYITVGIVFLCLTSKPYMAAFPLGVALAFYAPKRSVSLGLPVSIAGILISIYLMGYEGQGNGAYSALDRILKPLQSNNIIQIAGALLAIFVVENSDHCNRVLSNRFFAWLGYMSFPLYLVHLIVIGSLGSVMLLSLNASFLPGSVVPRAGAFAVTIIASFIVAIPVARANNYWTRLINRVVVGALGQTKHPLTPISDRLMQHDMDPAISPSALD